MSEKAEAGARRRGALEAELCRLRDELRRTPTGRKALKYIEDILTLMADQKINWDLAKWYVDSWTKG